NGSPIHYVIDDSSTSGIQYVTVAGPIYHQISKHLLVSNTLPSSATVADFEALFIAGSGSPTNQHLSSTFFCGEYDWPIYSGHIGIKTINSSFYKRVDGANTTYVTTSSGTTPVPNGWYYGLGPNQLGAVTNNADDWRSEEHTSELQSRENLV